MRYLVIGLLATMLVACAVGAKVPSYRYRMTVEIETPSGLRTGSGVIEVQPRIKGEGAADMAVDGQAVPIDLPGGRTIFALLRSQTTGDWAGWIVHWLIRTPSINQKPMAEQVRAAASARGVMTLPKRMPYGAGAGLADQDPRPTFVVFGDQLNPATVRIIDPDKLAAEFGKGTRLNRITFQITDDPVTTDLYSRLSWLKTQRGSLVHTDIKSPPSLRELESITDVSFERRGY